MHKLYNNDGKLKIIEGITRDEALELERTIRSENDLAITSSTASDEALLRALSHFSQNALCFYPKKLFLEEAIKRGLDIENIVSELPLLSKDCLYVPAGTKLWSNGKSYRVF